MAGTQKLTAKERDDLLSLLRTRFEKHTERHKGIAWENVAKRLTDNPDKLWSLHEMEQTGGEPDVVAYDSGKKAFVFVDCSAESPKGRRSLCYDRKALDARKENKPAGSALEMAAAMGAEILSEAQYRELQKLGRFDTKTSSWIATPDAIRKLGGALFCDCRFNAVFVYHNGAESYYAARGFRCVLYV